MKRRFLTVLLVLLVVIGAVFVVNAADAQGKAEISLSAHQTTPLSITQDTILDLNGYNVTANITVEDGAKLYIKDSADGYGKITGVISGNWMSENNYVPLKIDGAYSFHVGDFALENAANLRTKDIYVNGASVYFKGNIGATGDILAENVVAYGVAMRLEEGLYFAEGKVGGKTYTRYDGWINSDDNDVNKLNSVELTDIMRRSNTVATNKRNAELTVYCAPYVEMADGERLLGTEIHCSLKQLIEKINDDWDDTWVKYDHKAAAVIINKSFPGVLPQWNTINRINSLIDPEANTQANPFLIQDEDDLTLASESSVKHFRLNADIDMSAVKDWKPFAKFNGTFDGNSHAISNLTINGTGFFDTVAAGATVSGLHLRDVNVVVPSDSKATAVGMIAGTNKGSVTGVTVTGTLKDTREGSEAAQIYGGAIVGNNAGTVTAGTTNTITVSNAKDASGELKKSITSTAGLVDVNENDLTVAGLSADVGLFLDEDSKYVHRGLIGTGPAATNAAAVIWRDRSYSTERQAAELQRRRQLVEADVFEQGTMKWTPATTIKYWNDQTNNPNMEKPSGWWDIATGGKWHIHNQTFNPGTTYYGIPYTHCASPVEQAKYYMTEGANGVYTLKSEVTQVKGGKDDKAGESTWTGNGGTDKIGWGKYFGSDCTGALTTAWHKVSPILTSSKTNNGVCLFYTNNMIPSQFNQWYYGFKQVGDYEVDDEAWSTGTAGNPVTVNKVTMTDYGMDTTDMFNNMGTEEFYEAYAQSQIGDMVIATDRNSGVGHGRLIAADPMVIRNGNNVIDGNKSYFLFHEQGAGLYTSPGISSWRVNWKCSFAEAAMQLSGQEMGGNGNGYYLPITMKAFHDTKVAATGGLSSSSSVITGDDPIKYALNSSYRIMSATMLIKDEQGGTVYEATRFQGTSSSQARRRAIPGSIPLFASDVFSDCCANLEEGQTYYVTFSGTTYGGVTDTMMNNYKIVYTPTPAA